MIYYIVISFQPDIPYLCTTGNPQTAVGGTSTDKLIYPWWNSTGTIETKETI